MIRAPRLPSSASRIVLPLRTAGLSPSKACPDPRTSQSLAASTHAPLPLKALLGSWHICASTLPLWDARRSVMAYYAWPTPPADSAAVRLVGLLASLAMLVSTPHDPLVIAPAMLGFRRTRAAVPALLLAIALLGSSDIPVVALLSALLLTAMIYAPSPLFLDEITSKPRRQGHWSFTPATLRGQNVWDTKRGGQPGGHLAFAWRGRGWMRPLSARWQVLGWGRIPQLDATTGELMPQEATDEPDWLLTYFEATSFTPVGIDIYARHPLSTAQIDDVRRVIGSIVAHSPSALLIGHGETKHQDGLDEWRCLDVLERQLRPISTDSSKQGNTQTE